MKSGEVGKFRVPVYNKMAACGIVLRSEYASWIGHKTPCTTRKVGSKWKLVRLYFSYGRYRHEKQHRGKAKSESGPPRYHRRLSPYLTLIRADKPIGSWLLFWPCSWSIALAASPGHLPSLGTLALFGAGAFVMRSAGCIINDMWDRDVDGKVERTRARPLASGALTQQQALVYLAGHLTVGLAILLSLNNYSIVLGAASLPLVITYPLMKRVTFWPQLYLGLTMNWGALLGWAAVQGSCDWTVCLPLYASAALWTIVYDTIYAFQDIDDDKKIGVKSTARLFGYERAKMWLTGFAACMVSGLTLVGHNAGHSWPYFATVAACAAHLAWQIGTVNLYSYDDCLRKFKSNHHLGALLFTGIVITMLLKKNTAESSDNGLSTGANPHTDD